MSHHSFSHNALFTHGAIKFFLCIISLTALVSIALFTAHAQTAQENGTTTATDSAYASDTTSETPEPDVTATDTATQTTPDGEDGAHVGTYTGGTSETDGDVASITTGNASSSAELNNQTNINETDVIGADETTVQNENDIDSTLAGEVLSTTGENMASTTDLATIDTGSAISTANVLNVVNTNIFNAEGLFYFLNMLMGNVALDLRNLFSILTGNTPDLENGTACSLEDASCNNGNGTLTISNQNKAVLNTELTVGASSADNSASASEGEAGIKTGDAYAGANVMNVVNTNITNANYLLLSMNGFGTGTSDIVFPGADWFYELLRGGSGVPAGSSVTMKNDNTALVTTEIGIEAESGDNTADAPSADITTGSSIASTNVVNNVNTNIFGNSISLLFRVSGDWAGNVYGLPEGMSWRETPDGVEIYLDESVSPESIANEAKPLALTNTNVNDAEVTTRLNVFALTGDNEATAGEIASIETGNAQAGVNVTNVVNTNVLGRNWVLAIFNILGDWDGNISFGQPDLWVGTRAITPPLVRRGTCFSYEVTINNFGDASARDVYLTGRYNTLLQKIEGMEASVDGRLRYHVGKVRAGESRTITLPACLSDMVPCSNTVETTFEVSGDETDADTNNNTDMIGITTTGFTGNGGMLYGRVDTKTSDVSTSTALLEITKTASTQKIVASSSVDYTITITNNGDPINYALLVDGIYDTRGKMIHEQRWGLETIRHDETIIITYTATFDASSTPGIYRNEAYVTGTLGTTMDDTPIHSPVASVDVEVVDTFSTTPTARVGQACTPLLTKPIKFGAVNDSVEVSKLQYFLRIVEGNVQVLLTGTYDTATYDAVHAFQKKYASDILAPWGTGKSTGYVYHTTRKKINELWCEDREFPLTPDQEQEINHLKARVREYEDAGVPVPEDTTELIGYAPNDPRPEVKNLASANENADEEPSATGSDQLASVGENAEAVLGFWARMKRGIGSIFTFWRD